MKKYLKYAILLVLIPSFLFTGCKEDDDDDDVDTTPAFEVLTTYMSANDLDLSDVMTSWLITAHDLDSIGTSNYHIIDLRADTTFARGHIAGAVNTSFANIVTEAGNSASKPIVVVCYTGQSAAHAITILRLSEYSDAKSLKFGMSSWNAAFDSWTANTGNLAIDDPTNWSSTNTTQTALDFEYPTITSSSTEGKDILTERISSLLTTGFLGVKGVDVLGSPSGYFINNYWAEADVVTYGHITGAYRIKEDLTLAADGFKHLDPDATVVTYCWTGQTSSLVTAYLYILGYNPKSLKFGTNCLIHEELQFGKWTSASSGNYPVVPSK